MREVLTVIGPTRDDEHSSIPRAVREWCINTAAVNPATNSIFVPSEDGHFYRWNLATNSLDQALVLSAGIGEPYVPTVIGPDGTVYTLNGGTMFAIGGLDGVKVTLTSSTPDIRTFLSGQTVTFTANVAAAPPAGFDPTGTVTFEDTIYFIGPSGLESSTSVLAIQSLDASGNAAFTTSSLSAAEHFIRAVYGGDTYFSLGSITLVQKAHGAAATTTLVSSPNPSAVGQAVSLTATVAAVPPESEIPTGMVTFQEGSTVLAQLALSGGAASFNTSSLGVGSHPITAVYASDSLFAASSGSVTHVTNSTTAPTATTVSSSTNPSVFGQSVTFTAVVTSGAGAPTGNVTFRDGGTTLGSVALDSTGRAVLSIASLTVGTHSITAQYAGSGAFNSSSSAPLSQTVNRAATRVTVTSSVDPAKVGQAVKFTAIVAVNAPGAGIPAGSVTFLDKGKTLATVTLDATGTATFTTSTLNQGAHQISVSYAGNAGFGTSVSPTLVQNIKK
jgi:hypothetical protein